MPARLQSGNGGHMALGEQMVSKGIISQKQLDTALQKQKESPGEKIGEIIVKLGFATKAQVESCL